MSPGMNFDLVLRTSSSGTEVTSSGTELHPVEPIVQLMETIGNALVWAKHRGKYYPAVVLDENEWDLGETGSGKVWVVCLGFTKEIFMHVSIRNVKDFCSNFRKYYNSRLRKAVDKAVAIISLLPNTVVPAVANIRELKKILSQFTDVIRITTEEQWRIVLPVKMHKTHIDPFFVQEPTISQKDSTIYNHQTSFAEPEQLIVETMKNQLKSLINFSTANEEFYNYRYSDENSSGVVNIVASQSPIVIQSLSIRYTCPLCPFYTFVDQDFEQHRRTHWTSVAAEYKHLRCDFCSFCCSDENQLREHQMIHFEQSAYIFTML